MRTLLHSPRSRRRGIAAAVAVVLALVASLLTITPAQALNDTGTGGVFVPASGSLLSTTATTGKTWRTVQVAGAAGLPNDGSVGTVSVNATVSGSSTAGTLFARPDANTSRTMMLIYNGTYGEYTSNTGNVAVGAKGTIQIMTETDAKIILTVQGYYTANDDGTAPGGFVPVDGKRIVDTRSGRGAPQAQLAPGKSTDVQVGGTNGVPADASGAVLNLLAINSTTSDGYLTAYPTGSTRPSNALHYAPSTDTSIQAQVSLSANGKATIYNGSTTANLVIDLQGYFTAAGQGGAAFTPGVGRVFDSRATGNTILAKNETRSVQVAGRAGVPVMGSGLVAVVLTLTASHGGSDGRAVVWPDGTSKPGTTSINFRNDEIRTNTVTATLGANGKISLQNVADPTNYLIDVQGWYMDPAAPSVSCPAPYTSGTWNEQAPSEDIECVVSTPPARQTAEFVLVNVDGETFQGTELSATATTTTSVWLPSTSGPHSITASRTSGGSQSTYTVGYGDWTQGGFDMIASLPGENGQPTQLAVTGKTSSIPLSATYKYFIATADGQPVLESPTLDGQNDAGVGIWDIPATSLDPDSQYFWRVTVSGPRREGFDESTVTIQSDLKPLAIEEDADYVPASVDPEGESVADPSSGGGLTPSNPMRLTTCQFYVRWDRIHISSSPSASGGPTASVHGWWTNVNCKGVKLKATVKTRIQQQQGKVWRTVGSEGTKRVYSSSTGGGKQRSNGRYDCKSSRASNLRAVVVVDVDEVAETSNSTGVGKVYNEKCS